MDLGCGEGKLARPLSKTFDQVVAVDPSAPMIALGQSLPQGQAPNLSWITETAEGAALEGEFDLVTFAASIHWMDPDPLFRKLRPHLRQDHRLAIISGDLAHTPPWEDEWQAFLEKWVPIATGLPMGSAQWQASRDKHLPFIEIVEKRAFLSSPFRQSGEHYVLCQHSRNTFTLRNLAHRAADFRAELTKLLGPYADSDGTLSFQVKSDLTLARLKTA